MKSSRKLKDIFNIGKKYQILSYDPTPIKLKKRNWITFYHETNAAAYFRKVIDIDNGIITVEHWIHDIGVDNVSSSVQLPIIKLCSGCELKELHTKSKRKCIKQRCLLLIQNSQQTVKINAKAIDD
jgi:hypothetical protein